VICAVTRSPTFTERMLLTRPVTCVRLVTAAVTV
jgi:hypothetical protein